MVNWKAQAIFWTFAILFGLIVATQSVYADNVAINSINCKADKEYAGYGCQKAYDNILSASITNAWINTESGVTSNITLNLSNAIYTNEIHILQVDATANYRTKRFEVWVSSNSATCSQTSGTWNYLFNGTLLGTGVNYEHNFTNSTNWGNTQFKCFRINALDGYVGNNVGLAEIRIYNASDGSPPTPTNFSVTAMNGTSGVALNSFSISINNTLFTTTDGTAETTLPTSNAGIYTLGVNATGFRPFTTSVNISTNYQANMSQMIFAYLSQQPTNAITYNWSDMTHNITFNNSEQTQAGLFVQCSLIKDSTVIDSPYGSFNGTGTLTRTDTNTIGTHTYNWTCTNGNNLNITSTTQTLITKAMNFTANNTVTKATLANFNITYGGNIYTTTNGTIQYLPSTPSTTVTFSATNYQTRLYESIGNGAMYTGSLFPTNLMLEVRAINWLGNLVSTMTFWENHTGVNQTGTYFQNELIDYINTSTTNKLVRFNLTDYSYKNRFNYSILNISTTNYLINITLVPNQLILNFFRNGISNTTNGIIYHLNGSMNWTNSSLVVVQESLPTGDITIEWNEIGTEYVQKYQYYNDYTTHIDENLELLDYATKQTHFRAVDYSNSPLEDVTITAEMSEPYTTAPLVSANNSKYGQVMTGDDGYGYFYADNKTVVKLIATKTGYDSVIVDAFWLGLDLHGTKETAKYIYMKKSAIITKKGINLWFPIQPFQGLLTVSQTAKLIGTLFAYDKDLIEWTTNYRISQGLLKHDITTLGDDYDRYKIELQLGTDCLINSPCELLIYVDNSLTDNISVNTYEKERFNRINATTLSSTTESNNVIGIIGLIAIILLAFGIQQLIQNTVTVGENIFKVGMIIMAFLVPNFILVAIVIAIGFVLSQLKRAVIE